MHIQKTIEQLGFNSNETKVYLASLNLGEATISEIAQKAKIPRTSAQIAIQSLAKHGMMNFLIRRRRKYWIAENPEKLLIELKEKELSLKEIMPELQALRYDTGIKPTIRFYSGAEGVKLILDDIIESKRHILSLTSMENALELVSEDFRDFIAQRHKRYLRVRFLTNRSPETEALKNRDSEELRQTRFFPSGFELTNANFIYGEKVAIVSFNKKLPVGLVIEDKDIAKTYANLFEIAWKYSLE